MGELIAPGTWCRQRWCRQDPAAAHFAGDGCSCDAHGRPSAVEEEARVVRLTAKAARLSAFACRTCGVASRDMVEQPALFFRCPACAAADRWPSPRVGRA